MIPKNPLGTIKDLAGEALKVPGKVAGSAVGVARTATEKAAHAVGSLTTQDAPGDVPDAPAPTDAAPTTQDEPKVEISPDKPVNVTEELGLDPAPVDEPRPPKTPKPAPVTAIDAEADPSQVHVTPADVAEVVAKDEQPDGPSA
ncbi:hypothetical protein ACJ5H2_12640 [Nocardioides sp. R1-1]|uniref:hypothetical protein n=1 Tax=Nocardioides sp. R1-1 TaxID=3383502 RepID=UPI0038CFF96A